MPCDILEEYKGRLIEHVEGKKLLEAMLSLGVHLHNVGNKTKQAIKVFLEIFDHDPLDHLVSFHTSYFLVDFFLYRLSKRDYLSFTFIIFIVIY
jgi:hypothetical protein